MPSYTSNRSTPLPASEFASLQRFCLRLVVYPGTRVLADLSRVIERFTTEPDHLIGVVGEDVRVDLELSGVHPQTAEQLARRLIRQKYVIRLDGRCFDAQDQETFGIKLCSPR